MRADPIPEDSAARLEASDPRLNVALEASAGTGKTSVLVDRYLRLIESGADPRHILAITFTRKAAGEMRSRVIEELRKRKELWPEARQRLFDIHISTIDAFCLGLLKEFPLEAGIDPDVALLDEVDVYRLSEEAVEEALAEASEEGRPDVAFLTSLFSEGALRQSLRDLSRGRLVKEKPIARFISRAVPRDLELERASRQAVAGLREALGGEAGLERLISCGPGPHLPQWKALSYAFRRSIDPARATAFDIEAAADYFLTLDDRKARKKLAPLFTRQDFRAALDYERHLEEILRLAPAVEEVYRRWFSDRDLYAVRELWSLYCSAARRFAALKQSQRGLDFTDTLLRAVELLEKRGEFSQSRYRLESRYHHLLIDEFQDTNEAQWDLVKALIDSWGEGAGLVQEAILAEQATGRGKGLVREPSIFIVGDRKQSIYGWRDARVEVLERAARELVRLRPEGGRRLTIRQSFRSEGPLLAFLNEVFSGVPKIKEALEWSFQYGDEDHFPILGEDQEIAPVRLAVASRLERAAAAVADEAVRLLQEEHFQPKDIAILFRSRTHYRAYQEALAERGVPTYVYRGLGFFDSPEVRDIQALVRFLAEPGSELRAAELLRSRLIGLSDTALALLAAERAAPRFEGPLVRLLRGALAEGDLPRMLCFEDQTVAVRAAATVPKWLRLVDRVPPADLLIQILDETDYAAWFAGREGKQGWENLKKILEVVRRAQNRGYLTLSRLADFLDSAATGEESLAVLEAVDAVNLMTIHAAKGLEFGAVFVVNLSQKTRSDTSLPRIVEAPGGEVSVHALTRPEGEGPDRAIEEEKRLLYVALTRARRKLILSAHGSGKSEGGTTLLQLLPPTLVELFEQALTTDAEELIWKSASREYRLRVLRPAAEPRLYLGVETEPAYRLALEPLADPSPRHLGVRELASEQAGIVPNPWGFDPIDLAVGSAVHRLFEHQVPPGDSLLAAAESLFPELPERTPAERKDAARRAAELYLQLFHQAELKQLLSGGKIYREVPFSFARAGAILRGAIDCLVVGPRKISIIDYKTGSPRPEHQLQMELYLEAARCLFPGREVEALVFYPGQAPVAVGTRPAERRKPAQLKLF